MKTIPKLRARRMWANKCYMTEPGADVLTVTNPSARYDVRVAVIPLDDMDALISKATDAFLLEHCGPISCILSDRMRSALTAIGVLPRQRKGGAK